MISVTHFGKCGYTSILKNIVVIKNSKLFICFGSIIDGVYIITLDSYIANNSELEPTSSSLSLKRKVPSTHKAYL